MKSVCLLVVYLVTVSALVSARQITRVRAVDPWAAETLDRGVSRSAAVRALVRHLEDSDLIVHVATTTGLGPSMAGMTRFVHSTGGFRYVRIDLDRALLPDTRAAILGHELQHAREIAASRATDESSIRALFATIGHPATAANNIFETKAAAEIATRVWMELRGSAAGAQRIRSQ